MESGKESEGERTKGEGEGIVMEEEIKRNNRKRKMERIHKVYVGRRVRK